MDRSTWAVASDGTTISRFKEGDEWDAFGPDWIDDSHGTIRSVAADGGGNAWMTTSTFSIFSMSDGEQVFQRSGPACFIGAGADGRLWKVENGGTRVYRHIADDSWEAPVQFAVPGQTIRSAAGDRLGRIWAVTDQSRIYLYDSGRWSQITNAGAAVAVRCGADGYLRLVRAKGKKILTVLDDRQVIRMPFDAGGLAVDVAVDHNGDVWALDSTNVLYRNATNHRTRTFKPQDTPATLDHPPGFTLDKTLVLARSAPRHVLNAAIPPVAAARADGSLVVACDRSGGAVQVYTLDGLPAGREVFVNNAGPLENLGLTLFPDGGCIAFWVEQSGKVAGRVFAPDLTTLTVRAMDNTDVDQFTLADQGRDPDIATLDNVTFITTCASNGKILQRTYSGRDRPPGESTLATVQQPQQCQMPAPQKGGLWQAWTYYSGSTPDQWRITASVGIVSLTIWHSPILIVPVSPHSLSETPPPTPKPPTLPPPVYRATAVTDDEIVFAWSYGNAVRNNYSIQGQRYARGGGKISNQFYVAENVKSASASVPPRPSITSLAPHPDSVANVIVSWEEVTGTVRRMFRRDGEPYGPEFRCRHTAQCKHGSLVSVDGTTLVDLALTSADGASWNLEADVYRRNRRLDVVTEFAIIYLFDTYEADELLAQEGHYNAAMVAAAGFNAVVASATTADAIHLDIDKFRPRVALLNAHGLRIVVYAHNAPFAKEVGTYPSDFPGNPAVWGYVLENDFKNAVTDREVSKADTMHQSDPTHPTWVGYNNTTGPTAGDYHTDVIFMSEYAMSPGSNSFRKNFMVLRNYAAVAWQGGKFLYRGLQATTPGRAALGGGLQDRRYVLYSSIAYGVKGVLWFCGSEMGGIDKSTHRLKAWNDAGKAIVRLNEEIRTLGLELMPLAPDMQATVDSRGAKTYCSVWSTGWSGKINRPEREARVAVDGTMTLFSDITNQTGWQVRGALDGVLTGVTGAEVYIGCLVDPLDRLVLIVGNHYNTVAQTQVHLQFGSVTAVEKFVIPRDADGFMTVGSSASWQPASETAGTADPFDLPGGMGLLLRITL